MKTSQKQTKRAIDYGEPWEIDGRFDDDSRVEIVADGGAGIVVAELEPHDGLTLSHWGPESIACAQLIVAAPVLLKALMQIREMGYASQAARATDTVLACIRVAEGAILLAETGKR